MHAATIEAPVRAPRIPWVGARGTPRPLDEIRVLPPAGRANPVIPEMVEIGRRLASARRRQGLTQDQVARSLRTSAQALGQVENGWRAASVPWLHAAATAVAADLAWVLTGTASEVARPAARYFGGGTLSVAAR